MSFRCLSLGYFFFTSNGFLQLSQKVVKLQNIKERKDIGWELDMEANFITVHFSFKQEWSILSLCYVTVALSK